MVGPLPVETIYTLAESNITISDGAQLSGITQGDGTHLVGKTITLNNNSWQAVNIIDDNANFQDSSNGQTLDGAQTYDGVAYAGGERVEAEYGLTLQDPDGNTYFVRGFNINEAGGGASYATVEGLAFVGGVGGFPPVGVPLTVVSSQEGPSNPYTALASPPCFTRGCRLETPFGLTAVEDIKVGDLVSTLDDGPQIVRWVGVKRLPAAALATTPKFRPVLVKKDGFGPGQPNCDILLSPQHRILITGWRAELLFGEDEILVPAIKLLNDQAIVSKHCLEGVEYYHVMFDQHQIVRCDGLWTESYLPNVAEVDAIETQKEVVALFPELAAATAHNAARLCVSDKRTSVIRVGS
ncbi:Hint domain-containing protein [Yoonia maritima]|uniref:Hint domain-containing protein n=1 Tax=Yoonia maritima TaxID=1435347 RepID=UPI000D05708A|nr:Hint domain-containing protein [Yoonia maritima]